MIYFVFARPKNLTPVYIRTAFPSLSNAIRVKIQASSKKSPKRQEQRKKPQKRTRMTKQIGSKTKPKALNKPREEANLQYSQKHFDFLRLQTGRNKIMMRSLDPRERSNFYLLTNTNKVGRKLRWYIFQNMAMFVKSSIF